MAQTSYSVDRAHCSESKFCLKTKSVESASSGWWKVNTSVSSSEKGVYPTASCWIHSFLIQEKTASPVPLMSFKYSWVDSDPYAIIKKKVSVCKFTQNMMPKMLQKCNVAAKKCRNAALFSFNFKSISYLTYILVV